MASQKRNPRKDPKAALGEALRQLRLDCRFTQATAAAEVQGFGEDSIQKAETGYQVPVDQLYAELTRVYRVTPRERMMLDIMLENARNADPVVPEFAEPWLKVEPEATLIRVWALDNMPGLLQTLEYATDMFIEGAGLSRDKADDRAKIRVRRQDILVRAEGAPRVTILLYEPLLRRIVGGPEVMAEELEHILKTSEFPNVVIQVVPEQALNYFPGFLGQFEIGSGRKIPDTLNMITVQDLTTTIPAVVDGAEALFEEIRGYALSVADSREKIQEALKLCKGQQ